MTPETPDEEQTPLEELTGLLRHQRARWRRWFAGLLILLLAIALNQLRIEHVANEAKAAATTAQEAINLVLAQRTEARVNTCLKDKKFADAHNGLVLYFAALGEKDPTTDPGLLADFKAKNLVPTPDCTPEGIAAFYAGQGGTNPPPAASEPSTTTTAVPRSTTTTRRATTTTSFRPASSTSTPHTTTTTRPSTTTSTTRCVLPSIQGVPCL